ncbi:MAG: hypothetical protein AAGJ83_14590, partial [Planctomycetota bacterium]
MPRKPGYVRFPPLGDLFFYHESVKPSPRRFRRARAAGPHPIWAFPGPFETGCATRLARDWAYNTSIARV